MRGSALVASDVRTLRMKNLPLKASKPSCEPAKWITATNVGYEWVPYAGAIVYLFTVVPGAFVGYSAVMGAGRKCRQKG